MVHGESGFICQEFREFKAVVRELYENYPYRQKIAREGAEYARQHLCNPEEHRRRWVEALRLLRFDGDELREKNRKLVS